MSDTPDSYSLQARVFDLESQLAQLQLLLQGQQRSGFSIEALHGLYWEACRSFARLTEKEVFLWNSLIQGLDVQQLLKLGRRVQDPFPWKPFLVLLDHATLEGYFVDDATEHLLRIAQELLNIQGLWVLTPADVMGKPLAVQLAVSAVKE